MELLYLEVGGGGKRGKLAIVVTTYDVWVWSCPLIFWIQACLEGGDFLVS